MSSTIILLMIFKMAVKDDDKGLKKNYTVEVDANVSEDVKRELGSLPKDMKKIEDSLAVQDLWNKKSCQLDTGSFFSLPFFCNRGSYHISFSILYG